MRTSERKGVGLSFKHSTESMLRALLPTVSKKENKKKQTKQKRKRDRYVCKKEIQEIVKRWQ